MKKTKRSQFLEWCKKKVYVSSVDAIKYSLQYGFLDARKVINEFVCEGRCERLNWSQKVFLRLLKPENKEIAFYYFGERKKYARP